MKTDLPKLIDEIIETRAEPLNLGYLVCEKCNSYYKLQLGESPENFSDTCECGGKLMFETNLENRA